MRSESCPIQFRKHIHQGKQKNRLLFYHVENQICLISLFSFGNRKNVNKATDIYQIDWKQVRNWLRGKDLLFKVFKKVMPIWKSEVSAHRKRTIS